MPPLAYDRAQVANSINFTTHSTIWKSQRSGEAQFKPSRLHSQKISGKKSPTGARKVSRQPVLMDQIGVERGNLFPQTSNSRAENFSSLPSVSKSITAAMSPTARPGAISNAALINDNIRRSQNLFMQESGDQIHFGAAQSNMTSVRKITRNQKQLANRQLRTTTTTTMSISQKKPRMVNDESIPIFMLGTNREIQQIIDRVNLQQQ